MVYCRLMEKAKDHAVYSIGVRTDDMTGKITFYSDQRPPVLDKQADKNPVGVRHIGKLYGKYMEEFAQGDFREKLAYEIG